MSKLNRRLLIVFSFVFLFILLSVIFSSLFLPGDFTIATGDPKGNYHKMGLIYKKELENKGVKVNLVTTKGSLDNLALLNNQEVDMAFLQNNLINNKDTYEHIKGIASLYNEPIFVFYRKDLNINLLSQLKNKRVALGAKGSGTFFLSKQLLQINGLNENDVKGEYISPFESAQKLSNGDIDAAFIVSGVDTDIIKSLIFNDKISLFNFSNYKAYKYHSLNLNKLTIPQGYYDIGKNIPEKEINLLTCFATLASKKDLSPKIIETLLIAIREVTQKEYHKSLSFESDNMSFPSDKFVDFELHSGAELFFKEGPSFLTQYFSYTVALLLSRLKFFLIPLIPFILIFIRVIPGIYNFRVGLIMKSKYRSLISLEKSVLNAKTKDDFAILTKKINELKQDMDLISQKIPPQYQRNIYDWKMHMSLIENIVDNKTKALDI